MAISTDALMLLKKDHKKVKEILEEIMQTTDKATKKRQSLFEKLAEELSLHEHIEETLFYPTVKNKKTKDLILESYQEHHFVDKILEELKETEVNDETWIAKLKVLAENVKHHIKEEEQSLFPMVQKIMNKNELKELGEQMESLKQNS
jgi:iron-sulfur cluster repair protein YtfE (RIC family)